MGIEVTRKGLLLTAALGLCLATEARAQQTGEAQQTLPPAPSETPAANLQTPPVEPPPPSPTALPENDDQIQFTADLLEYDNEQDVVTATGDVRLYRRSERLRADKVVWNRKTGRVSAEGNVVVVNPQGDSAYGDKVELTDSLKDGVVENMLVVFDAGGRVAAQRGERHEDGSFTVDNAAYTPCSVTDSDGCPKEPSWKITAARVIYEPAKKRLRYSGARVSVFGLATIPLPVFSHPVGGDSASGFLTPDLRYNRTNGFQFALPYYFSFAPNRDLTVTPRVYTSVLPMLQAEYRELNSLGAFRITGYGTYSRRADDLTVPVTPTTSKNDFRGYLDAVGNFQLDPNWSAGASLRLTTDRTFLRRYDISRDDRLRNNIRVERIDPDSYLSVNAWVVQTLRVGERQGLQAYALPELDYRRRMDDGLVGGRFEFQVNTLAIGRSDGQDSQRAFASARWDLRRLTRWGQEVTLTAYARASVQFGDAAFLDLAGKIGQLEGPVGECFRPLHQLPLLRQFLRRFFIGEGDKRIAGRRHSVRRRPQPRCGAVDLGQRGDAGRPDETEPRPGPSVFGGLEQERPGPVAGQRRVQPDRGDRVGQQGPGNRNHSTALGRERGEFCAGREGLAELAGADGHGWSFCPSPGRPVRDPGGSPRPKAR